MSKQIRTGFAAAVVLVSVGSFLSACIGGEEDGRSFTLAGEDKEIQGTVVGTELTLCGPDPDKPGTCEGHLIVRSEGAAEPMQLEVTRDVVLKKDGKPVFLPQLNGSVIRATYRTAETGENVATSVVAAQ